MNKLFLLIISILISSHKLFSQCVLLNSDTVSIITISKVNYSTKEAIFTERIVEIGGVYYCAQNVPFDPMDCISSQNRSPLFYLAYDMVTNYKALNRTLRKLDNQNHVKISKLNGDSKNKVLLRLAQAMEKYPDKTELDTFIGTSVKVYAYRL